MKRTLTAVVFVAFAVPTLAAELPFEQTELDRALPDVAERPATSAVRGSLRPYLSL